MEDLKKTILITGAGGFIGSHLVRRLKESGSLIYAVSRNVPSSNYDAIHWIKADVSNLDELKEIFEKVNPAIVFHLASHVTGNRDLSQVEPTLKSNLISTVNLLTLVTLYKCKRFVSIGSMEEPQVNSGEVPNSPYSVAKWASTGYCRMFYHLYNTPVVTATLYMVYGPAQKDTTKLIPYVTTTLLQNTAPKLSTGKREVDWIYIDDVIEGLVQIAITPGIEGEIIEIGSGRTYSIRTVVEKLVEVIKPSISPLFNALEDRPLEKSRIANIKRSQKLINWKPQVSLDDGLAKTVNWYKENNISPTISNENMEVLKL